MLKACKSIYPQIGHKINPARSDCRLNGQIAGLKPSLRSVTPGKLHSKSPWGKGSKPLSTVQRFEVALKGAGADSAATKREYRGVNVLMLWAAAEITGYQDGRWATFKQWLKWMPRCAEARRERHEAGHGSPSATGADVKRG
jgi:hypothetical protein